MKTQRLASTVRELNNKVSQVTFEFQMKISDLKFKLKPTTMQEVREQRGANIRESMTNLDAIVIGYTLIFEQVMELWTNLQEDPNLQKLSTNIR